MPTPLDIDRAAARLVSAGFAGPEVDDDLLGLLRRGVRTVILFARNAGRPEEVRALCAAIRAASPERITICVDQEGGDVQRLTDGFEAHPALRVVGREGPEAAARAGTALGRELADVGIDYDLAPVLDVDTNPENPVIGARAFDADPAVVASCGAAFIIAMQATGVRACGKHFPGHGDTALDSHFDLPVVPHDLERLRRIEFPPFRAAIEAGVASIMTAHVMVPALDTERPATLSPRIITGLLREEFGYEGVIVSDDLEMKAIADRYPIGEAAVQAIEAGVDLVLCCHQAARMHEAIDAIVAGVHAGRLTMERLEASHRRLDAMDALAPGVSPARR